CRPVVVAGDGRAPRVDVGSWAAIVLGADGGAGSEDLCRPLALRPAAFGLQPGSAVDVHLRISLIIPDQDIARVRAELRTVDVTATGPSRSPKDTSAKRTLTPAAEDVVTRAIAPLVEALRGLGGESSAAAVDLSVRCSVANR
ncbi:MAG: hypothetical protein M3O50_17405, partial [Myxococcota bacterium]|nr:hypothetical protein [Myxococcota bacterium]